MSLGVLKADLMDLGKEDAGGQASRRKKAVMCQDSTVALAPELPPPDPCRQALVIKEVGVTFWAGG